MISSFGGLSGTVPALVSSSLLTGVPQVPFVFNVPMPCTKPGITWRNSTIFPDTMRWLWADHEW